MATKKKQKPGHEIESGCGVWLKSGGPPMIVESVAGDIVQCVWFTADESGPIRDDFDLQTLELMPDHLLKYKTRER